MGRQLLEILAGDGSIRYENVDNFCRNVEELPVLDLLQHGIEGIDEALAMTGDRDDVVRPQHGLAIGLDDLIAAPNALNEDAHPRPYVPHRTADDTVVVGYPVRP